MSQPQTKNPYARSIGVLITPGLNSIIAALPGSPTEDDLATAVSSYIAGHFYSSVSDPAILAEISSVAYHVINSIRNNLVLSNLAMYKRNQIPFVELLIGHNMASVITPDAFVDRVADIEDNIGISELTVSDQIPLFLATTCGSSANAYWAAQIAGGGGASWFSFLSTNAGQNYMNTLQWSMYAMNGALAGYGATPQGLIAPTTNITSVSMICALAGALTATAGKLIFNWIPRIVKPLSLNIDNLSIPTPVDPPYQRLPVRYDSNLCRLPPPTGSCDCPSANCWSNHLFFFC